MADTTTITLCPFFLVCATLMATFLILSTLPTDVPPYFWTIKAIDFSFEKPIKSLVTIMLSDFIYGGRSPPYLLANLHHYLFSKAILNASHPFSLPISHAFCKSEIALPIFPDRA